MTKRLLPVLVGLVVTMVVTVPVLAAYYVEVNVTESNGTDYDMLAVNTALDINTLVDYGFIRADGLDTRVQNSAGGNLPFMLATDKVLFATPVIGDRVTSFEFTTDSTPMDDFYIVTGDGGYVTITDNANLELGANFELEFDAWVDTGQSLTLLGKTGCIKVETGGSDDISATIYRPDDIQVTTDDVHDQLYSGNIIRAGERIDDFPIGTISQVSFYIGKGPAPTGNPTGTAYVRCRRVSDDGIVGTFGTIDVSTLDYSKAWYDFTDDVYNPSVQNLRFTIEYNGGDSSNYVFVRREYNDTAYPDGDYTRYISSWSEIADDCSIKILFGPDIVLTATSITAGEVEVKVTGDGSGLKLYVDDSEKDSETLEMSVDNSNNWVISNVPYMDYYTHTTSGTLRINYDPDSIISGTTLPNEDNPGTYDGVITWGTNPAGITVNTSSLMSDTTITFSAIETGTEDIINPQSVALVDDVDLDALADSPLKPGVDAVTASMNLTERLAWLIGAALLLIITVGLTLILTKGDIFLTCCAGGAVAIGCYIIGIFDWWVILIFGLGAIQAVIRQKMPRW